MARVISFKPSTSNTRNGQMVKNEMFVYKKKHILQTLKVYFCKSGWQKIDGNWYYFKNMSLVKNAFVKKGKNMDM